MMWSSGLEKGCGRFICTSPHGFRVLFCTIHSSVLLFPELKITELKANRIHFVFEISRLSLLGFSALLPWGERYFPFFSALCALGLGSIDFVLSVCSAADWLVCPLASMGTFEKSIASSPESGFIDLHVDHVCLDIMKVLVSSVETDLIPP